MKQTGRTVAGDYGQQVVCIFSRLTIADSRTGSQLKTRSSQLLSIGLLFEAKEGNEVRMMKLEAVVQFLGDRAHYSVTQVKKGIYDAHLMRYEGPNGITPPENVTLVRGVRHWVGSYDEPYFVDELGQAIEERLRDGHPHKRKGSR